MPINFPDNPSVNDEFESGGRIWKWNGTTWDSVIASYPDAGKFIASTTAPQNPQQGQGWFDPDSAQFFIYYDNAWVEVGATLAGPAGPTGPTGPSGEVTKNIRTVSTNTTLLLNDKNNIVAFTGSSLQTLTLANVLEPGSSVKVLQLGSGQVRLSPDTGVSLSNSNNLFGTSGQNTQLEVLCTSSGQYLVLGEAASVSLATGGLVTTDGTYTYHTFTSNGTFVPSASLSSVDYLIVAGGGGGGYQVGGGGGAGGLRGATNVSITPNQAYPIVIGAGGAGATNETTAAINGSDSSAFGITSTGGGRGSNYSSFRDPSTGGSGGGGSGNDDGAASSGAAGIAGQGNAGGNGFQTQWASGGGGGAGGAGQNASANTGGAGGVGSSLYSSWGLATFTGHNVSGTVYYAGGGGGSWNNQTDANSFSAGGLGGGGRGFADNGMLIAGLTRGEDGIVNTGGGGGGVRDFYSGSNKYTRAGSGASGIVIIRYQV